jgi:16S rRNA (uracil1498-N3)-methyltransferase
LRRRFFVSHFDGLTAEMDGEAAHHLGRVLRGQEGQLYELSDGQKIWLARIEKAERDRLSFALVEELPAHKPTLQTTLLLAVVKFDAFEWAIEKATELGIAKITPILARRTEKHLAHAALRRAERWRRIALESSKQSRRTDIPEITDHTALKQAVEHEQSPTRILLSETEQATTLSSALSTAASEAVSQNTALAIGPEGGWTPEEISLFTQHQWQPVTLGPRILRAETAAIAAIAIASSHLT